MAYHCFRTATNPIQWDNAIDDAARRLVWSVVEGRPSHHNGSIQILPEGDGCRLIWIADILPHELKAPISAMMQQGMDAMKRKLESA